MQIHNYADLTWPEVARLPRQWPLVIPLGLDEYDMHEVARQLAVENLIQLPAIPYGFHRQDHHLLGFLSVRPALFRRVLNGIRRELSAQGFQRVLFLNGHGDQAVKTGNHWELYEMPCQSLQIANWPDPPGERVVVIGTGHTEQHGYHLPLSTDTLIVEGISQRLSEKAPSEVFCLPTWPYGVSTHTRQFPGTLNLGGRVFDDFFLSIVECLVRIGAKMIYFSNGHGGNHSFLVNVVKLAGEQFPDAFIATEWLHTTGPTLDDYRQSERGGMGHGGELETSFILHLRPDLVHMERATTEMDFVSTPNYYMDWVEGGRLIANPPWRDDTTSGIYGDGRLGTAQKGVLWLQAAVEEKLESISEIRQQHHRRVQKRAAQMHKSI